MFFVRIDSLGYQEIMFLLLFDDLLWCHKRKSMLLVVLLLSSSFDLRRLHFIEKAKIVPV